MYQGEASLHRGGDRAASRAATWLRSLSSISAKPRIDRQSCTRRPAGKSPDLGGAIEAALAITLLAPMVPMLFMGEEWGSKAPFPFFCDFQGDLAEAVRKGRRKEYAGAYAGYGDEIPDPLDPVDFSIRRARLGRARNQPPERRLALVQELLAIRRREIVPRLAGAAFGDAHAADNGLLTAELAHGRSAERSSCWPTCRSPRDRRTNRGNRHDLGRRDQRPRSAMVGVLASGSAIMPPAIPIATYRVQLTANFRFRRGRRHRPLSESARHHASLCIALHEGAQGQHPWL